MKVLTQKGFKEFDGILDQGESDVLLKISFNDKTHLKCTHDHELLVDDIYLPACFLEVGDTLISKKIINIEIIPNENVYDLKDVETTNSYYSSGVISHNCNLVMLDEFAFVNDAATFYTSTYPVITGGKSSKVIIVSTANGIGNQFQKIWEGANQGTNSYIPFRVDWWDVPGRDEAWKEETINNTSQLQFDQEFGNTFFGTGDTLIDPETLMNLKAVAPIEVKGDTKIYTETIKGHEYIMMVDVAKGIHKDYSTFNIIDVTNRPFKQVAVYKNNKISPLLFPDIIVKYAKAYNDAYVVVENNDQGMIVCNGVYYELEYENFYINSVTKANGLGVFMDKKVKRLGCSGFKDVLENGKLHVVDEDTILEISTFEAKGTSYEASDGNNDDLVMNLVLFGYFAGTRFFSDMTDINLRELLFEQKIEEIEADIVPFGFFDDGLDAIVDEVHEGEMWQVWIPDTEYDF